MDNLLTEDEINKNFDIICNIYDPSANIQPSELTMSLNNKIQQLNPWMGNRPIPTLEDLQQITKDQIKTYKMNSLLSKIESECKCNLTINNNNVLFITMVKMFWLNSQQVFPNKTKEQFATEYSSVIGICQSVILNLINN